MILTKTPLRIGLLGGGTDVPEFYSNQKTIVFGGSINKYVYVVSNKLSKFSQEKFRFTYRNTESVNEIEEFKHPVTRETLRMYQQIRSLNLATMSDIPGGTGLGSSSAFTVGLIKNLDSVINIDKDPLELAQQAIFLERNVLRETGGIQDQIYSSIGGLRFYSLDKDEISFSEDFSNSTFGKKLSSSLCLIRVGGFRNSHRIHFSRISISESNQHTLKKMSAITFQFKRDFDPNSNDVTTIAEYINESWKLKKSLDAQSSSSEVDSVINSGLKVGAIGAKLCGAGHSGFVLFICDSEVKEKLRGLFGDALYEDISFTGSGSTLMKVE
jgi:D-glycero-alpha-D-manno-heptose-7-phosphate kinase